MDEMKILYQNAFSGVTASPALRERTNSASPTSTRYVHRLSGVMAAAILMLALMGCGTVAAIWGDSIQSWMGHYWEVITGQTMTESQSAVIDHLSQDIGLSQMIEDVTVTVDSAAVGDDIFYLLLRVEGPRFSSRNHYGFLNHTLLLSPDPLDDSGGIASHGMNLQEIDGDGSLLLLLEHEYTSSNGFFQDTSPLEVTLTLEDLSRNPNGGHRKTIQDGIWEFSFTLDRTQAFSTVPLPDTQLPVLSLESEEMVSTLFTHMEVTNTGLRFRYNYQEGRLDFSLWPVALLSNGLEMEISGGGGSVMSDGTTLACSYHWRVPIDLDELTGVRFGDTIIPIP